MSDKAVDGWRDAALYVIATTDKAPIVPIEALRALYRRGGEDRALAEELHALASGVIA